MTWSRVTTTGLGTFGLRLMVEGWPDEWVTDPSITHSTNAATRRVLPGLQYDGIKISERAVLRDAWIEAQGISFRIGPTKTNEDTLGSFTRSPEPVGYLYAAQTTTSNVLVLDNSSVLPAGYYHIATECVYANGSNGLTRAQWDTKAQAHPIAYGNTAAISVPMYNYPPTMEGRRCFLYAYGPDDSKSGDGTQIWMGTIVRPPKMDRDGITWILTADSIIKALDQSIAPADELEYRVRGIYHHYGSPMKITVKYVADASPFELTYSDELVAVGFYETRQEWVDYVNSLLDAWLSSISYEGADSMIYDESSGVPEIDVKTNSVLPGSFKAIYADVHSAIDGDLIEGDSIMTAYPKNVKVGDDMNNSPGATYRMIFGTGSGDFKFRYVLPKFAPKYGYPLSQARSCFGLPNVLSISFGLVGFTGNTYFDTDDEATYPANRLYLNTVEGLSTGDVLVARNGDDSVPIKLTNVDTTDRYIEGTITDGTPSIYISDQTTLIPMRVSKLDGNLADFIAALIAAAPDANTGDYPYVTDRDCTIDTSSFSTEINTKALVSDYWKHRNYAFVKAAPIKDIMKPELAILGKMVRLESDGSIGVTNMPLVTATAAVAANIGDEDILLPAGRMAGSWPRWEAQVDGLVNIVNLKLGYHPVDDEYDDRFTYSIRDISSIAQHKSRGRGTSDLEIKSTSSNSSGLLLGATGTDPTRIASGETVAGWVANYLRVLSTDYATVTIEVPFKFFGLLLGDIVSVTCATMPNGSGTRGVTARKGAVIGREWNLDPASGRMGSLTIYFPRDITGGYTPSGRVTAQSNVSGDTWTLTLSTGNSMNVLWSTNGDGDVVENFAINDKVRVVRNDNGASPTTVLGTVTDIDYTSHTIEVTFDSSWTPSSYTWNLDYQTDDGSNLVDRQRDFVYIADTGVALTTGDYARRFL